MIPVGEPARAVMWDVVGWDESIACTEAWDCLELSVSAVVPVGSSCVCSGADAETVSEDFGVSVLSIGTEMW